MWRKSMKRYNGRVDKSLLVTFSVVIVICISLILLLLWFFGYFRSCNDLKGNLFDEKVLKKYEVSWLEKPKNAINERQYIEGNFYIYECQLNENEQFENYTERIFQLFVSGGYTLGYEASKYNYGDEFWNSDEHSLIKFSNNISDYRSTSTKWSCYIFYYTLQPKDALEPLHDGLNMGSKWISIRIKNEPEKNGKFSFEMVLFGKADICENILLPD